MCQTRVFISYARPDQDFVEWLARELAPDVGLDVFYDAILSPGDWRKELVSKIVKSDFLVTVVSENIYQADGEQLRKLIEVEATWAEALEADDERRPPFQSFVIRIDGSPIPEELRAKNCIDFRNRERGLKKIREYLISDARVRRLFFDRKRELQDCYRVFREDHLGHGFVIYNFRGRVDLGSSYLLKGLKVKLPEELAAWPVVLLFDEQHMERPEAWLDVLDETVDEFGASLFPAYLVLREYYACLSGQIVNGASKQRSRSPMGISPTISGGMWGLEMFPQKVSPQAGAPPIPRGLSVLDNWEMAWQLTLAFFADLDRNELPVAWLLDWPRNGPRGSVTHEWLCTLLRHVHEAKIVRNLWVVVASSKPVLPSGQIKAMAIPHCSLAPFDEDAIEEYVRMRAFSKSPDYWNLLARIIFHETKGIPGLTHDSFDNWHRSSRGDTTSYCC